MRTSRIAERQRRRRSVRMRDRSRRQSLAAEVPAGGMQCAGLAATFLWPVLHWGWSPECLPPCFVFVAMANPRSARLVADTPSCRVSVVNGDGKRGRSRCCYRDRTRSKCACAKTINPIIGSIADSPLPGARKTGRGIESLNAEVPASRPRSPGPAASKWGLVVHRRGGLRTVRAPYACVASQSPVIDQRNPSATPCLISSALSLVTMRGPV